MMMNVEKKRGQHSGITLRQLVKTQKMRKNLYMIYKKSELLEIKFTKRRFQALLFLAGAFWISTRSLDERNQIDDILIDNNQLFPSIIRNRKFSDYKILNSLSKKTLTKWDTNSNNWYLTEKGGQVLNFWVQEKKGHDYTLSFINGLNKLS